MFKGYPLRDYTWKDWALVILSSTIVLQIIILFGTVFMAEYFIYGYGLMFRALNIIYTNAAIYGAAISLPLTLIVVHMLKIPVFNRRQIPKSEWFIIPGMTREDWSFLVRYIPISFTLFTAGNILMTSIFGEVEAVNQEAIESMMLDVPIWGMFLMVVIVAPITEEVLFRGLLLFRGSRLDPTWFRVILSAILFGLVHRPTNIPSIYTYVTMGLMFSYASKRTQSVESAIVYHFLNNLLAFISLMSLL